MICTEYRIKLVHYWNIAKAAFFAVEESIYEIPIFGEAESITLRDEKVDVEWTDRLQRTFTDLGLEWREPSWHLEVIDSRTRLDTEASIDPKFIKACGLDLNPPVDWLIKGAADRLGRDSLVSPIESIEARQITDTVWEVIAVDHPRLELQKRFSVRPNEAGSQIVGPLVLPFCSTDGTPLGQQVIHSYVNKVVRRYTYLANQLKEGVNLDNHTEWQKLSIYFKEKL